MILPHELADRIVIPSIRASVARRLIERYRLSQEEAANKLGVTQSAISNYTVGKRGSLLSLEEIQEVRTELDRIAKILTGRKANEVAIMGRITDLCSYLLRKRFVCSAHESIEPNFDSTLCDACNAFTFRVRPRRK